MKRNTTVAIETRDMLFKSEASAAETAADVKALLARVVSAKSELGYTGTIGEAAIARATEAAELAEQLQAALNACHGELHTLLVNMGIRGVAISPKLLDEPSARDISHVA